MSQAFVDHCLELLCPLGPVRARRMFGGHGLYANDVFVALIAFERLYLKVDGQTEAPFAAAGCEPFVYEGKGTPVRMSYWSVPDEAMESPALMAPWARLAMQAAVRAASRKSKSAPPASPGGAAKKPAARVGPAPGRPRKPPRV